MSKTENMEVRPKNVLLDSIQTQVTISLKQTDTYTHTHTYLYILLFFSCSVVSDCLWPHGRQHTRLPVLQHLLELLTLMSFESAMSSNHLVFVAPFSSSPQSFPASGSFPVSWLVTNGGQKIGASASASVLPMNIQGWFSLGLTDLISLYMMKYMNLMVTKNLQKILLM